ncbi:pyridoxamine 5'-phosphate oxidase family protein [Nocardioides panacisoli]|uniref:pyridoxamine 5'-phosphate oxidase family protein n=1 Tax=Nocardioides panacisoli TaxID=627624 RepID=UPI001C63A105|nr:pyridoxamine 5'-phosphate oxidase family protein [Nocardioides panacisoli]QYJ03400.1 pyridoxamine 5'-phosphate oxidase family protein [Nocardioides panacisoli]
MQRSIELPYDECRRRLSTADVGRVAICAPDGPQIVPVNYVLDEESIIFRIAPYSLLGTRADGARLAFEVDHLDHATRAGWSVVASGPGEFVADTFETARLRMHGLLEPWAGGARPLHVRIRWTRLTGRAVGAPPPRE